MEFFQIWEPPFELHFPVLQSMVPFWLSESGPLKSEGGYLVLHRSLVKSWRGGYLVLHRSLECCSWIRAHPLEIWFTVGDFSQIGRTDGRQKENPFQNDKKTIFSRLRWAKSCIPTRRSISRFHLSVPYRSWLLHTLGALNLFSPLFRGFFRSKKRKCG